MCRQSAYHNDLYARAIRKPARESSKPARSLVEVLRDLFRPRRAKVQEAEVLPFPAGAAVRADSKIDGQGSEAA